MNRNTLLAALIAGISATAASPLAIAQQTDAEQGQPSMQQPSAATDVSEADLRQFLDAQQSIMALREEYTAKLQNAEGQEAQQQVQMQANQAMTAAVQDAGIEVQEFNQIAMALQSNEELRNRYMEMAQQAQGGEGAQGE